jgi:hypothetical protein
VFVLWKFASSRGMYSLRDNEKIATCTTYYRGQYEANPYEAVHDAEASIIEGSLQVSSLLIREGQRRKTRSFPSGIISIAVVVVILSDFPVSHASIRPSSYKRFANDWCSEFNQQSFQHQEHTKMQPLFSLSLPQYAFPLPPQLQSRTLA